MHCRLPSLFFGGMRAVNAWIVDHQARLQRRMGTSPMIKTVRVGKTSPSFEPSLVANEIECQQLASFCNANILKMAPAVVLSGFKAATSLL